jgi:hypothetical protein
VDPDSDPSYRYSKSDSKRPKFSRKHNQLPLDPDLHQRFNGSGLESDWANGLDPIGILVIVISLKGHGNETEF